jgi:hypothetical protein
VAPAFRRTRGGSRLANLKVGHYIRARREPLAEKNIYE